MNRRGLVTGLINLPLLVTGLTAPGPKMVPAIEPLILGPDLTATEVLLRTSPNPVLTMGMITREAVRLWNNSEKFQRNISISDVTIPKESLT